MGERNPIFGKGKTQIGYIEGGEAFDLSGRKRCNYSKETGNLFDDSTKTVGHVSLTGKFVGVSSIADQLFPKFDAAQTELRGFGATPNQPLSRSDELPTIRISLEEFSAPNPTEVVQLQDENEERAADAERRGVGGSPSQSLSEASQVTVQKEPAEQPSAPDPTTEVTQLQDENEQRALDAERRGFGETPSQPPSEASRVTTLTESAAEPSAPDPTEVIQLKDENEQRAANAERHGVGETPNQPLFEASQVTTLAESAEQLSAPHPTEAFRSKHNEEERAGDAERRGGGETPSQPLSEASQVMTLAESTERPSAPDPTHIQLKDENEERAADAECRGVSGSPSQSLSEASQVTVQTEPAEQPSAPDPTEVIQLKDENEQRAANAERRGVDGSPSQALFEASQVTTLAESAEQLSAPHPTEAFRSKHNEEERAANAKRRGGGETPSQPLSEASQVMTLAESTERPSAPDPTHIQLKDENEERAADAECRGFGETPSQPPSEASRVTTLTESAAEPSAPDPTEVIRLKDENEQRAPDAERRGVDGSPSQALFEASQVTTLAESAEQLSAPDPTEVIRLKDENEQRAPDAERRGVDGSPSQALFEASQVTTLAESAEQLSAPHPTEAFRSKHNEEERAGDAERRGVGGAPSQPLSEAGRVTTHTESSAPDPTAIHSNDAEDNRIVKILKALERTAHARRRGIGGTSREPLSTPSEVLTPTASLQEPSSSDATEALHSKDAEKNRLVAILKAFKRAADAKRPGIGRTPRQPFSAPTKVTATKLPEEPSVHDSAESFHSNDADRDRIVKVLKALMKRS